MLVKPKDRELMDVALGEVRRLQASLMAEGSVGLYVEFCFMLDCTSEPLFILLLFR
jgi:hypothetical protein